MYYAFTEIWTPLKMFGIRIFEQSDSGRLWVKVGARRRKPLECRRKSR